MSRVAQELDLLAETTMELDSSSTGAAFAAGAMRWRVGLARAARRRALLGLMLVIALGPSLVAMPESGAAQHRCAAVRVLGVRGSGETASDSGGFGRTVQAAVKVFRRRVERRVEVESIDYPAFGFDVGFSDPVRYYDGVRRGIQELKSALLDDLGNCPKQSVVLVGYSQGAMVVNRALGDLARRRSVLRAIAAVELLADPQRLGSAPYVEGTASPGFNGLGVFAGALGIPGVGFPADDLPMAVRDRSRSYCIAGDLVCAWDPSTPLTGPEAVAAQQAAGLIHTSYVESGYARAAGRDAARKVRQRTG